MDALTKVLAGLIVNTKAADHFVHKAINEKIFYEYSKKTSARHGQREARFLANVACKYFDKYNETVPWSVIEKALDKVQAPAEKKAVYQKTFDECTAMTGIKFGEWVEHLDSLISEYRKFKHKEVTMQAIALYGLPCLGKPGSRGPICAACDYADECKAVQTCGGDLSTWILDWSTSSIDDIKLATNAADIKVYSMGDLLTGAIDIYEEDRNDLDENGNLKNMGIPTPFPTLTEASGGWRQGRYYMVWARSGVGKSAFLLQCANEAVRNGYPVLYFNLEMPTKEELVHRVMAYATKTDFGKLMRRQIDDGLMQQIKDRLNLWQEEIKAAPYCIVDLPKQTQVSTILNYCNKFIAKYGRKVLIVIDYFGLLENRDKDTTEGWNRRAAALHSYFRDENTTGLTAGQLNRSADGAKRISPKHIRDCDKIPDHTDACFALINLSKTITRFQLFKHRFFLCEDILLERHLHHMGFKQYDADAEDDIEETGGLFK